MTPIHTELFILFAGGLWSGPLPDEARLSDTLQRLDWVRRSSWTSYAQSMPYVPGLPHWSWLWSELVHNQVPFGLSPYTWLAYGGPRVADSLYEVVPFADDHPVLVEDLAAWDALRLTGQKYGASAMLLSGHVFWRFKTPLEGHWAPSQKGEKTVVTLYEAWEEEALMAIRAHSPHVKSVRLMPGGPLTRLKPTGWRSLYTHDKALQGLGSRVGIPVANITDKLDTFISAPRAPGKVLMMDSSLCETPSWEDWLERFETIHQQVDRLITDMKPGQVTWLLSGTQSVLSLTPQAASLWPWRRTPEPLNPNLFTEPNSNL